MPTKRPVTQQEVDELKQQGYNVPVGTVLEFGDLPQETSAVEAGGRSALASALPTAVGGGAFAATMAALAPETMGASLLAIPVGMAASYLAGKGTSKLQEQVMSEEFKRKLALGAAEHPTASMLGGLATAPLGGLSPSTIGLKGIRGGIGSLITGAPMTAAERYGLVQAGMGGGLGIAQEAATAGLEGRDITAKDLALAGAQGLMFTKPTPVIGPAMGFHEYVPSIHESPKQLMESMKLEPQTPTEAAESAEASATGSGEEAMAKVSAEQKAKRAAKAATAPIVPAPAPASAEGLAGAPPAGASVPFMITEAMRAQLIAKGLTPEQVNALRPEDAAKLLGAAPATPVVPLVTERPAAAPVTPAPAGTTPIPTPEAKKILDLPVSDRQAMIQKFLNGKGMGVTENYIKAINQDILGPKGLTLIADGTIVDSTTGKPVKGLYNKERPTEVRINPEANTEENPNQQATLDTIYHESMHARWQRMTKAEQAQYERAARPEIDKLNEQRKTQDLNDITPEEHFAGETSMEYLTKGLGARKETPFQTWKKDFAANFKRRFGRDLTPDEAVRTWNYQMMHEGKMPAMPGENMVPISPLTRAATATGAEQAEAPTEEQTPLQQYAAAQAIRQAEGERAARYATGLGQAETGAAGPTPFEQYRSAQAARQEPSPLPDVVVPPAGEVPPATPIPEGGRLPYATPIMPAPGPGRIVGRTPEPVKIPPATPVPPASPMMEPGHLPPGMLGGTRLGEQIKAGERPTATKQWYPTKGTVEELPRGRAAAEELVARRKEDVLARQKEQRYSAEGLQPEEGEHPLIGAAMHARDVMREHRATVSTIKNMKSQMEARGYEPEIVDRLVASGHLVPDEDNPSKVRLGESLKRPTGRKTIKEAVQERVQKGEKLETVMKEEEARTAMPSHLEESLKKAGFEDMIDDSPQALAQQLGMSYAQILRRSRSGIPLGKILKAGRLEKFDVAERISAADAGIVDKEGKFTDEADNTLDAIIGDAVTKTVARTGGKLPGSFDYQTVRDLTRANISDHGVNPDKEGQPDFRGTAYTVASRFAKAELRRVYKERETVKGAKTVSLSGKLGETLSTEGEVAPEVRRGAEEEEPVERGREEGPSMAKREAFIGEETPEEAAKAETEVPEYKGEEEVELPENLTPHGTEATRMAEKERTAAEQGEELAKFQRIEQRRHNRYIDEKIAELQEQNRSSRTPPEKQAENRQRILDLKDERKMTAEKWNAKKQMEIDKARKQGNITRAKELERSLRVTDPELSLDVESTARVLGDRIEDDKGRKMDEIEALDRGISIDDFFEKYAPIDPQTGRPEDPTQRTYQDAADKGRDALRAEIVRTVTLLNKLKKDLQYAAPDRRVGLPVVAEKYGSELQPRIIMPSEVPDVVNRAAYIPKDSLEYQRLNSKINNITDQLTVRKGEKVMGTKANAELIAERNELQKQLGDLKGKYGGKSPVVQEGAMRYSGEGLKATDSQKTLLEAFNEEFVKKREHQWNIYGPSHTKVFNREKYLGFYEPDLKKGFTRYKNDISTASHEAIHSFLHKNVDAFKQALAESSLTKDDLMLMREMLISRGHSDVTINAIGKALTEGRQSVSDPIKNKTVLDIPFQEIITHYADGDWHKGGKYDTAAQGLMEKVLGREMVDKIDSEMLVHTPEGTTPTGRSQAKWDETLKKYYSSEGLLPSDRNSFLQFMESTADRLEKIDPRLASAARRWDVQKDIYEGWTNEALMDLSKFNKEDVNRVNELHRKAFRAGSKTIPTMTGEDAEISNILKSIYHDQIGKERRITGMPRTTMNPTYVPEMLSSQATDTMVNRPGSPEALAMKRQWADHMVTQSAAGAHPMTRAEAIDTVNQYVNAIGSGGHENYLSINFGALRKAEGLGLPDALRETNAMTNLQRYGKRAARDMAFYREMENRPIVAALLGLRDDAGATRTHASVAESLGTREEVRDMMKNVTGNLGSKKHNINQPIFMAGGRLINNSLMGLATGIRDTATIPANMLPYISRFSDLTAAMRGMANYRNEVRNAVRYGANKPHIDRVQFNDIMDAPSRFANGLNVAASFMRLIQGREHIEQFNRNITFAAGKEIARNNVLQALSGDAKAKAWLEKFGTQVAGDPTTQHGPALDHSLNVMAKNFVDRNQGSYGLRGLPNFVSDSPLSPFLSMQKWGIEKSNTIYKDVVNPFITGKNRLPMLTYTLGSILTGAAIQQLNKALTGRKGQEPELKEVAEHGKAKDYAAQVTALMQLGSFGGIIGDALHSAVNAGVYGTPPRSMATMPLLDSSLDFTTKLGQVTEAIRTGENPVDVLGKFALDVITKNFQNARIAANYTLNANKLDRADKMRDLRVFEQLEGKPSGDIPNVNPYLGMGGRQFKRTEDIGEAAQQLPALIKQAQEQSGGDYEKFKSKLEALTKNQYRTMPSMESNPMEFMRYYQYIQNTQGAKAANDLYGDFLMQGAINKAKASMVPRI